MSWSRRALLIGLAAASLAGCGFHPLYSGRLAGEYDPELAAIKVAPIPDRQGQILAESLREKLNPRGVSIPVRYVLTVSLDVTRSDFGIQRDATSTRGEINVRALYTLDPATGASQTLYAGRSRSVSSFNVLNDGYATQVAAEDARDRALKDLADDIFLNLELYVKNRREASR
jgi:LPS-assembly lipoprotein